MKELYKIISKISEIIKKYFKKVPKTKINIVLFNDNIGKTRKYSK